MTLDKLIKRLLAIKNKGLPVHIMDGEDGNSREPMAFNRVAYQKDGQLFFGEPPPEGSTKIEIVLL